MNVNHSSNRIHHLSPVTEESALNHRGDDVSRHVRPIPQYHPGTAFSPAPPRLEERLSGHSFDSPKRVPFCYDERRHAYNPPKLEERLSGHSFVELPPIKYINPPNREQRHAHYAPTKGR